MRSFAVFSFVSLALAHGLITSATGNAGGAGSGLGFVPGTSGTSQSDVTVFSGNSVCGSTPGGGANNIATGTQKILQQQGGTLPQVSAGGSLSMTYHQVNGDGAGPLTCQISTDATGNTFSNLQVTSQVPGTNGRSNAANANFPLVVSMPANLACTGNVAGQSNVCIVRCKNPTFGGCVPVQQAGGAGAAAAAVGGSGTGANAAAAAPANAVTSAAANKGTGNANGNTNANANKGVAATSAAAAAAAATSAALATAAAATAPQGSSAAAAAAAAAPQGSGKGKGKGKGKAKTCAAGTGAAGAAGAAGGKKRSVVWNA